MSNQQGSPVHSDSRYEVGDDFFEGPSTAAAFGAEQAARESGTQRAGTQASGAVYGAKPLERSAPQVAGRGWGRGPRPVDQRKYYYDVTRARASPAIEFDATALNTMDAKLAGFYLHKIHCQYGIENEIEARIRAFDKALWLEHTLNGASLLQPGHGVLTVGSGKDAVEFDIEPIKRILGTEMRRFFRAYADDIAEVNKEVLDAYDAYNPVAAERASKVLRVAFSRGLAKYPYLAHDSSDACTELAYDERMAVEAAAARVIPTSANGVEQMAALATENRKALGPQG